MTERDKLITLAKAYADDVETAPSLRMLAADYLKLVATQVFPPTTEQLMRSRTIKPTDDEIGAHIDMLYRHLGSGEAIIAAVKAASSFSDTGETPT